MAKKANFTLYAEGADKEAVAAAEIIIGRLSCVIGSKENTAARLTSALAPVYGVAWNRMILTRCDTKRINAILVRLRNSLLPRNQYDRLVDFWLDAYFASTDFPAEMVCWGILAERCRLDLTFGRGSLLGTCLFAGDRGFASPAELASCPSAQLLQMFKEAPNPRLTRALWSVAQSESSHGLNAGAVLPLRTKSSHRTPWLMRLGLMGRSLSLRGRFASVLLLLSWNFRFAAPEWARPSGYSC